MNLDAFLLQRGATIREAMERIDQNTKGIALVVDDGRLVATITDGDIRRAMLAQLDPQESIEHLLERPSLHVRPEPLTAPVGTSVARLIQMMADAEVRHVPLLDADGRVSDLASLADLVRDYELPITAVVMAGGVGSRLRPLTDTIPKPMLPVGGRPLLEHIIDQLRLSGVRRVNVTTHYRAEMIADHFGDGSAFGVDIAYVEEDEPLGTAGALGRLEPGDGPLLVMNGDILTKVDFRALFDFHREHDAMLTMSVRREETQLQYGVVTTEGELVTSIEEKPTLTHFVNAGIYLLAPEALRHVPTDGRYDMTDLVARLIEHGERVVSFPIREYWVDIGHNSSYEQAGRDVDSGKMQQ